MEINDPLSAPPRAMADGRIQFHASTVAVNGQGLLIVGPSGCGKSQLALALIGLGAELVADDITWVTDQKTAAIASCPPQIAGQIEARRIGVLSCPNVAQAPLSAILDLGNKEEERLPALRYYTLFGNKLPLLYGNDSPHFPAALKAYMLQGVDTRPDRQS